MIDFAILAAFAAGALVVHVVYTEKIRLRDIQLLDRDETIERLRTILRNEESQLEYQAEILERRDWRPEKRM